MTFKDHAAPGRHRSIQERDVLKQRRQTGNLRAGREPIAGGLAITEWALGRDGDRAAGSRSRDELFRPREGSRGGIRAGMLQR